jgi:hypothetical protein
MLSLKIISLPLAVFLFTFSVEGVAESQAPFKDSKEAQLSKKKWKVIDGFRSAKFGFNEKEVLQAIAKDFKVSKKKIARNFAMSARTRVLSVYVPELMSIGGSVKIQYILGFKSKKLIQVNIVWLAAVSASDQKIRNQEIVQVANLLRGHFNKKRYQKAGYRLNSNMKNGNLNVFRGKDRKNRTVDIVLGKKSKKNKDKKNDNGQNVSLRLSYILSTTKPDVFGAQVK